jgi:hypothetical protein
MTDGGCGRTVETYSDRQVRRSSMKLPTCDIIIVIQG